MAKVACNATLEELDTDGDGKISFEEFEVLARVMDKHTHIVFKQPSQAKCKDLLTADAEMIEKAKGALVKENYCAPSVDGASSPEGC